MTESKRQRQKQERAARREAERKAARRKELLRRIASALGLGLLVAVLLLIPALFGGDEPELPETYQAFRDKPTACGAEAPEPREELTFAEPQDYGYSGIVTATLATSCGDIVIEMDSDLSPATVNSFAFLSRQGFFDGTVFHRIVPDFLVEGGDPNASGLGGPGYTIPDEFPPDGFVYEEGVVAMANSGRGTTGSRFFIVTGDQGSALSETFNVLGRVVSGMDAVNRIASIEVTGTATREVSDPTEAVYIESVDISD